jgi:hypothetical protein
MLTKLLEFHHQSEKCNGVVSPSCIYLVEGFEFWVEGLCSACGKHVRIVQPLEALILMCPNPKNRPFFKPPLKNKPKEISGDDKDFLKEMGIDPE